MTSRSRPTSDARLTIFDDEMHLDLFEPLAIGDTVEVIRGGGPRDGEHMGTATVTRFRDEGDEFGPEFFVDLG